MWITSIASNAKRIGKAVGFSVMILGFMAVTASADNYYENFSTTDGKWTGGNSYSSNGAGVAYSTYDSYGGYLRVFTSTLAAGNAVAEAWVQRDFTYGGFETYFNYIEMVYSVKGALSHVPAAASAVKIYMKLYDLQTSELLFTKSDILKRHGNETVNNTQRKFGFSHVLEMHKDYRVVFGVYASCDVTSYGSATLDFNNNGMGYLIQASSLSVSHEHNWATTWGGDHNKNPERETRFMYQYSYDLADQLNFRTYTSNNKADELDGWEYHIRSFDEADSARYNQKTASGWAWLTGSPNIPKGHKVKVKITHWLNHSAYGSSGGCVSYRDIAWSSAKNGSSGASLGKAMADHGWEVMDPVPAGPDTYTHTLVMNNSDLTDSLLIRSLTILATMDEYEELSAIEFPDETLYDLSLNAGDNWSIDITTDGPMFGGYIYFGYNIYDPVQDIVVSSAWASHHIASPLEADPIDLPLTGGQVDFPLDAGKDNGNRSYLVVGGVTGMIPGMMLPGGQVTLPINWDIFSDIVMGLVNSPMFSNFMGKLAADGTAAAQMIVPSMPSSAAGLVIYFAYCLNSPFNYVSNPVAIEVVP